MIGIYTQEIMSFNQRETLSINIGQAGTQNGSTSANPEKIISGKEDAANNIVRGYHPIIEIIEIGRFAERSLNLQGFFLRQRHRIWIFGQTDGSTDDRISAPVEIPSSRLSSSIDIVNRRRTLQFRIDHLFNARSSRLCVYVRQSCTLRHCTSEIVDKAANVHPFEPFDEPCRCRA